VEIIKSVSRYKALDREKFYSRDASCASGPGAIDQTRPGSWYQGEAQHLRL